MKALRYIFLLAIVISLFSCKKFKGSQEIPAYLRVEPWTFTTTYDVEGAATHAITDAWVYVDGNLHGCFEMKVHEDGTYVQVPLLEDGAHKLHIYPGIKMNGIASTRVAYPFYKPYIVDVALTQGEISTISPSTKYYSTDDGAVTFKWMEDFEDVNNIQLFPDTTYSRVGITQISHRTDPNAWLDPIDTLNHYHSGQIHIGDTLRRFRITSSEISGLPSSGEFYVLLEMDYKCSAEMLTGMFLKSGQQGILDKELIYLKTANDWKKVYINLTPILKENTDIEYIKFYMMGSVEEGASADYYYDNLKLIYR